MGLNNLKPDANSKFNQGYYIPKNPNKYGGNLNSGIVYRSSLEKKVCIYCDMTPGVTKWSCESIVIQYNDHEGKSHRYYPDFYLEFMTPDKPDFVMKYVLEVKPYVETIPPVIPENLTLKKSRNLEYQVKMYRKNMYKWTRAIEWCKSRDMVFRIVTEKAINSMFM